MDIIDGLISQGLRPPSGGDGNVVFAQGVILSWDSLSGLNTVSVNGAVFNNLLAIQSGVGIQYSPGDVVALQRYLTSYFITGKVAAPGAGSAAQIAYAEDNTVISPATLPTYPTFGDIASNPGPAVTTYIGSSRRAFVIVSMLIRVQGASSYQGVAVSGASTIAPTTGKCATLASNAISGTGVGAFVQSACTKSFALTAADGLQTGLNTFTTKYSSDTTYGLGGRNDITSRNILVIPF